MSASPVVGRSAPVSALLVPGPPTLRGEVVAVTAPAHDPEVAEWMGLDTDIEGIVLATEAALAGATPLVEPVEVPAARPRT